MSIFKAVVEAKTEKAKSLWLNEMLVEVEVVFDEGELDLELLTPVPERHWLEWHIDGAGFRDSLGLYRYKDSLMKFLLEEGLCPGQRFSMHLKHWAQSYWTDYGQEYDAGIDILSITPFPFQGDPADAWDEVLGCRVVF